jgi:hypothetical protein
MACRITAFPPVRTVLSFFGIHVDFLRASKGGFYFHPIDEDLSLGTPERKKPLESVLSVYTNSEKAVSAALSIAPFPV